MDAWYMSEMAFYPAWEAGGNLLRNDIPNRLFDPVAGHEMYRRFLDEYALADEEGLNLYWNEHHSTATCGSPTCTLFLAALARETKKARLMALGMMVGHRSDPVRIAEEFAVVDVISGGRVEMGMVRGGPHEVYPANLNPTVLDERFWEAHDIIVKAMTSHDGPFRWEGKHFQYRQVNVWPRAYQTPHPPIWMPVGNFELMAQVAAKGYTAACLSTGFVQTRKLFDAYRRAAAEHRHKGDIESRLAYLAFMGVGDTKEEGFRRASAMLDYVKSSTRRAPQYATALGYTPTYVNAQILKDGKPRQQPILSREGAIMDRNVLTIESMINSGTMFAGTPDMVFNQIKEFYDHVGGLGHLLLMAQATWLDHADTCANIKLFAREVLPRLKELRVEKTAAAA